MKRIAAGILALLVSLPCVAQDVKDVEYTKSIRGTACSHEKEEAALVFAQNEDQYKGLQAYVNKANKGDPYKFPAYDKNTLYVLVMAGQVKQTPGWQITIDAVRFVPPAKTDKDNGLFMVAVTCEPPGRVASDTTTSNWQLVKIDKTSLPVINLTGQYKAKLVERRITFREADPISLGGGSSKPPSKK